jgi:antitoxin (DNA-binding transcriptional repressor) of toxin-antitoxin stability system
MKVVRIEQTKLEDCIRDSRRHRVIVTRKGKPVALIVGVEGMDLEQVELGLSDKFLSLVGQWRKQKTVTRKELEKRLAED